MFVQVDRNRQPEVARALLAAAGDDRVAEIVANGDGFYVPDDIYEDAYPDGTSDDASEAPKPAAGDPANPLAPGNLFPSDNTTPENPNPGVTITGDGSNTPDADKIDDADVTVVRDADGNVLEQPSRSNGKTADWLEYARAAGVGDLDDAAKRHEIIDAYDAHAAAQGEQSTT